MKKFPWAPIGIAIMSVLAAGLFAFTDLKSDVRILDKAWAAGEKNYQALDTKVGAIQQDLRRQGTSQAVATQRIKDIQEQIKKLEKSSSENNRMQAEMLRKILSEVSR